MAASNDDEINKNLNIEQFLKRHSDFKAKVDYSAEELEELIEIAKSVLRTESALCETGIPINIVGDIHGQFADLQRIFAACGLPGKERYLFLGDYVDRGSQSLECICLLLAYKIRVPNRIFLLRGNHECDYVNRTYGFWDELQDRFSLGPALRLFKSFNELFCYFPLAALIQNRVLCMHGGLSPHLNSLDDIRKIKFPVSNIGFEGLAQDLLWADPKYDLKGFEFNKDRECSVSFGKDVVYAICKKFDLDLIVRAHQVMHNGYGFFADHKLVTVFSAPRYIPEINNRGAVLKINKDFVVSFIILNPVKHETAGEENFRNSYKEDSKQYSSDTTSTAL